MKRIVDFLGRIKGGWITVVLLAGLVGFLLSHLQPMCLLQDTMAVGGDTPAHNYLAGHLKHELIHHHRIISWADGWWAGFPMFQYYFPLPYLLVAILSVMIPFNIAFKLVSVLGLLLLPVCAWAAGRLMRLPDPAPWMLAIDAVLFLFVKTHLMWGANMYSTLAGMIANSLSFALMVLFIGAAYRDAEDQELRLRSVLLLCAVIASHFFTFVIAALTLLSVPLVQPRNRVRAAVILGGEVALASLLMAWWLVPLFTKAEFSVDFGENWNIRLLDTLPSYALWLAPLGAIAIGLGIYRRCRAVWIWLWMLGISLLLFAFGFQASPVFVNVRLWPFFFFALLALYALGGGLLIQKVRGNALLVLAAALAVMVYVERAPNEVREWARWNYEGAEKKAPWPAIERLLQRLAGTSGRLAYDLTEDNNALGSTRIFESVPHRIGKPILEGGLVNSAVSAHYAYYIQGETSQNCAGFPTIVRPTTLHFTNATLHLDLFNVRHFMARGERTKKALRASPQWRLMDTAEGWELYERATNTGGYVAIATNAPLVVQTSKWKEYSLEWLYTPAVIDRPVMFRPPAKGRQTQKAVTELTEAQFRQFLSQRRNLRGEVTEWLHVGPFGYPTNAVVPLDHAPIDEQRLDPVAGMTTSNRKWQVIFSDGPMDIYRIHHLARYYVAYNHVNIFSPEEREALLHFAHDDSGKLWLNGILVAAAPYTSREDERNVPVHLKKGRNRLLYKIEQKEGGCFFAARITDRSGRPFQDLICTTENYVPRVPPAIGQALAVPENAIRDERVENERIRFRTDAVGFPHIIKISYFPNWKIRGAERIDIVSPAFMLVYPTQSEVELYYGRTKGDLLGLGLATAGWVVVAGMALQRHRRRRGYQTPLFTRITGLKIADAGLGLPLCWLLGYLHFLFARRAPIRAEYQGREASEILMLRPGGMGDMLLMVPVIRKLRAEFPRARIDIICESRNLDVLRIAGLADCALPYDTQPLRLCWHLIRRRYDIAIDSEQFHHFSAIMAFFSRAPIRIGYKINPARNQLYTHLVGYDMDGFEGRQFARLLKPLNISDWNYSLEGVLADTVLPLPSLEKAKDLQAAIAAGPFVAVHAGSRSPYKTWGTGKFIALIQGLGQRQTVGIVLVGAASESASSAAIVPYIDRQQIRIGNGVGRFTLAETAAIIRRARLFIGGDSGLGHLAVALGTPTVLIFGPSDSHKWGHSGTRHKVVQRPLACAPCFIFGYHRPCRTFQCLAEITPEAVLAACDELLRSTA